MLSKNVCNDFQELFFLLFVFPIPLLAHACTCVHRAAADSPHGAEVHIALDGSGGNIDEGICSMGYSDL